MTTGAIATIGQIAGIAPNTRDVPRRSPLGRKSLPGGRADYIHV
jgi:hypothetical protein